MPRAIIKFNINDYEREKARKIAREKSIQKKIQELTEKNDVDTINEYGKYNEIQKDYEHARVYYKAAANLGNTDAMVSIARTYEKDYESFKEKMIFYNPEYYYKHLEELKNQILNYYKKAAINLNEEAIEKMAKIYYDGVISNNQEIIKSDKKEAFKWFQLLAECNNKKGNKWLAYMYYNGIGVEKDYNKAFEQYQILAQDGDIDAQEMLAAMYENGKGTQQDYAEAYRILKSIQLIKK